MARPRAFNDDTAIDAAIDCFWQRGLDATTVRDLAAHMGINGPSLYNAFGDKRALFAQALERYAECSMRQRLGRLETTLAPKRAIVTFFEELIAKSACDHDRRGCFIVNSAIEVAPHDACLRSVIAAYLGEIEGFFSRCIVRGQEAGEIPRTLDSGDCARLYLGLVLGMRVAARSVPDRALLDAMARPALGLLDVNAVSPGRQP